MWLAGVRFSQHIAQGGSLISALSGRRVLAPSLRALHRDLVLKSLDAATRKRIDTVLRAMPETGFDWSAAMKREEGSLAVLVGRLQSAPDPRAYYAKSTGVAAPADFTVPAPAEVAAFHAFMGRIESALTLPPGQWHDKLTEIEKSRAALHPFFQGFVVLTPAVERGSGWVELAGRRQSLLDAVTK